MKNLLLVFGLMLCFVGVNAQSANQSTPEQRAHIKAMEMQKQLSLTEDQTAKVEQVLLDGINKVNAVKADNSKTADQQKTEIATIRSEKEQQLSTILTPGQYQQYQDIQAKKKARRERAQSGE